MINLKWTFLHPKMKMYMLGFIPDFLHEDDPEGAVEQIDRNYQHGGGWHDSTGFTIDKDGTLHYPDDPPLKPLAMAKLRDETIYFYEHSYVSVVQPDGTFRAARID